jgi:CMP-N-acetylneuraminic acid synthetase
VINNKKILAVIPARYGSKRLKQKNLLKINSKSLIELTYLTAQKSKFIDRIVVSTDNAIIKKECAKIDKKIIINRPKYLAKDNVKSEQVLVDVINKINNNYYYILLLQPTSPLRTSQDIDSAIIKIEKYNLDNLVSIFPCSLKKKYYISILGNLLIKTKKKIRNSKKNFQINGAIYLSKTKIFLKKKSFFSKKTGFIVMPKYRSIDIDYKSDYIKAKKFLENDFTKRKKYN